MAKRKRRSGRSSKPKLSVSLSKVKSPGGSKAAVIVCRVSPEERAEMIAVADKLGVTLSEYLRQLHRQAVASIKRKGE